MEVRAGSSDSSLLPELHGLPFVFLSAKQEPSSAVMARVRRDHGFENTRVSPAHSRLALGPLVPCSLGKS